MIILSESEVLKHLSWSRIFPAVEAALKGVAAGKVVQNPRTGTHIEENRRLFTMPGYLKDDKFGALACKLVGSFKDNHLVGLDSINATICLFDERTGIVKAVIAGTEITKWRTGAASLVATKYLHTKRNKTSKILAIVGCGAQGKIHAEGFYEFFKFEKIRLWNLTPERGVKLAQELNQKYNTNIFEFTKDIQNCLKEADVVVTATYASEPFVKLEWIKPGAHINAVGAGMRNHYSELDENLYRNSSVYIDHWNGAKSELSGLETMGVKIRGEVGAVITGDLQVTEPQDRITVFQSLGMAVEDCAVARLVFDTCIENIKSQ